MSGGSKMTGGVRVYGADGNEVDDATHVAAVMNAVGNLHGRALRRLDTLPS